MRIVSDINCKEKDVSRQNQNTHFYVQELSSENGTVYDITWKNNKAERSQLTM